MYFHSVCSQCVCIFCSFKEFNINDSFYGSLKVLALVFIRKLMDLCFTKRELSWLDDLMPESKKKKEDDKKKKEKAVSVKTIKLACCKLLENTQWDLKEF